MSKEKNWGPMTPGRGSAIGFNSGLKGGGLAGSLGGALIMALQVAAGQGGVVIAYTAVVGFTTGLMAGAFLGGVLGLLLGGLAGWLWLRVNPMFLIGLWASILAAVVALLTAALVGEPQPLPLLAGAVCGGLGGWWSGRDFVKVGGEQEGS